MRRALKRCTASPTTTRSPYRTSAPDWQSPATTSAGPTPTAQRSGSTWSSASSSITSPPSTGCWSTTAWTRCGGTGCTSVSPLGGGTDVARTAAVSLHWRGGLGFEGGGASRPPPPVVVDGAPQVATPPVQLLLPSPRAFTP